MTVFGPGQYNRSRASRLCSRVWRSTWFRPCCRRSPLREHPKPRRKAKGQNMRKAGFSALLAGLLALAILPADSAETATPNDTARFLAGLPPDPGSPLAALAKDPSWERHARYFNTIFTLQEKTHLSRIREFSRTRLSTAHDTMFYMFSGPAVLHAVAFFPKASNYVLSAKEPVGEIPELTTLPRGVVLRTLKNIEAELNSLLNLSFFITE